jgi:hypothetical protein
MVARRAQRVLPESGAARRVPKHGVTV